MPSGYSGCPLLIERHCARVLPVNRWSLVQLAIRHTCARPTQLEILDGLTSGLVSDQQPCQASLLPGQITRLTYRLKALRRAPFICNGFSIASQPLGPLVALRVLPRDDQLKVFPDFSAISAFKLLARDQHTNLLGIKNAGGEEKGLILLSCANTGRAMGCAPFTGRQPPCASN